MIGIERCSAYDNLILAVFLTFIVCTVFYQVRRVQREQRLKLNHGRQLAEGEIELTSILLFKLLLCSMVGGLVGAMGLGGAIIFNPILLTLGVLPQVVAATGMYLIMYS